MGFEYTIKFLDPAWLEANRGPVVSLIRQLPSFVRQEDRGEFWLKGRGSTNSWDYDVRLFPARDSILVEVSSSGDAFSRDVAGLLRDLSSRTGVTLVDDDDEVVEIE